MNFVPNGASRQETAILLVGTAEEFGVSQQDIRVVQGGFMISDALNDILTSELEDEDPKPAKKAAATKKTSGSRAAKKNPKEGSI